MARHRASSVCRTAAAVVALALAGCGGGDDPAADEPSGGLTEVTHVLEPTPQMERAAAEQCLADPELDVGYVQAVDPETGRQLAEHEVDCAEVRSDAADG